MIPYRNGLKGIELILDLMTEEDIDYRTIGTAYGDHWQDIIGEMIEMDPLLRRPGWVRRRCEECDYWHIATPQERSQAFRWATDESHIDARTGEPVVVCLGVRRGYDWLGRPTRPGVGIECLQGCSAQNGDGRARVCLYACVEGETA